MIKDYQWKSNAETTTPNPTPQYTLQQPAQNKLIQLREKLNKKEQQRVDANNSAKDIQRQ